MPIPVSMTARITSPRILVDARLEPDRAAGRGKFDGIRHEIEQGLLEPPLVSLDRPDIARTADAQRDILHPRPLA